jgi:3-dehydroquinate dehydratase-2
MMKKILVLHGPNLNLLGTREPQIYGTKTLNQINDCLVQEANRAGLALSCHQNNSEGELINLIHNASLEKTRYLIFNPAGFTHTSIALRDALCAVDIPFIEVHLSNIYSRESFRHHSYFSDIAKGTISGLGALGYSLALTAIIEELERTA